MTAAVATAKKFDIKGELLSLAEYLAYLAAPGSPLRKSGGGMIYPEALLGFEVGNPIDFKPYEKLGFIHPKNSEYYMLGEKTDPEFQAIYDGIKESGKIDDDILVNIHTDDDGNPHLLIVDGATRSSVISYLKAENGELFKRVSVRLISGEKAAIQGEMFNRNLPGRNRALREYELLNGVAQLNKAGWTDEEIADRTKISLVNVKNYINASVNLITPVKQALKDGKIGISAAFEAAKLPEGDQKQIAEQVAAGEVVRVHNVRKKNENITINVPKRINRLREKELPDIVKGLKAKRLYSKVGDEYTAFADALEAFAAAVDAVMNPDTEPDSE